MVLWLLLIVGTVNLNRAVGAAAARAGQPKLMPIAAEHRVRVPGGSYLEVSPPRLRALLQDKRFILVNVHVPYAGEIARTDLFIPFNQIARHLAQLPRNKTAMVVLYCRSGRMGTIAARSLVLAGYRNIWNLAGGMDAWKQHGFSLLYKAR